MRVGSLISKNEGLSLEPITIGELASPSRHFLIFVNDGPASGLPCGSLVIGTFQTHPFWISFRPIIGRLHGQTGKNRLTNPGRDDKSGRNSLDAQGVEVEILSGLIVDRVGDSFRSGSIARTGDQGIAGLGDVALGVGCGLLEQETAGYQCDR